MLLETFLQLDAWILSLLFFVFMVLAWWLGQIAGERNPSGGGESSRIEDAGIALFGLLLAFSFSNAANRYENRKSHLSEDAIAIGDFATTASALDGALPHQIHEELIQYVKQRLEYGQMKLEDPKWSAMVAEGRTIQDRIWKLVQRAIREQNTPSIHNSLLKGFNGMTMAHDNRHFGVQNHAPGDILLMLVFLGLYATFVMGKGYIEKEKKRSPWIRVISYSLLISLVFAIMIDLEQPRKGLMRVSQAPMKDLLNNLSKEN
ncbi:MAG: hypothetical protein KF789_13135 [Bdellovibrionaceae bacterium]|nr:hypothetical protein [Pseudobdellovibrionaceae bacterium]